MIKICNKFIKTSRQTFFYELLYKSIANIIVMHTYIRLEDPLVQYNKNLHNTRFVLVAYLKCIKYLICYYYNNLLYIS